MLNYFLVTGISKLYVTISLSDQCVSTSPALLAMLQQVSLQLLGERNIFKRHCRMLSEDHVYQRYPFPPPPSAHMCNAKLCN